MRLATEKRGAVGSSFFAGLLSLPWVKVAFVAALFILVSLVLFSRAVMNGVSHDEYQFVAGGQFFRSKGLIPYVDYPFLHMPYMPVIYGLVLFLSQSDLLAARLLNEFFLLLSIVLLFALTTQVFRNTNGIVQTIAGVFAVLLFLTDPSFVSMDGRALNHSVPVLLSISMVWVYWKTAAARSRKLPLFICGVLAGIATGARLSYAVLIVPVLFAVLFDPAFTGGKDKLRGFAAFGAGLAAALLPAGILFLLAPRPFIYGNFHYIALNTIYRQNLGYTISMNLLEKLSFFYNKVLSKPTDLLLYYGWICFLVLALVRWVRSRDREAFGFLFVSLFGLVLLLAAFAPTPLWPQYFFGPVPFLILGLFLGISSFFRDRRLLFYLSLASIFVAVLVYQPFAEIAAQLKGLMQREAWTTTQIHRLGDDIRSHTGCVQNCKVLTLVPILPLEAGLDTYPMFTVGSFSWRTAPLLSEERRAGYRIISYDDLYDYLSSDPPAAILTGTKRTMTDLPNTTRAGSTSHL